MVSYLGMGGRFGNILLAIYTVYNYCNSYKIDYDKIFFYKNGLTIKHNYFSYIKDFFVNIYDKFSYDKDTYNLLYKTSIKNNKRFHGDTVTFKGFNFSMPERYKQICIFSTIFYNNDLWEKTRSKTNFNLKNYYAVHIRRKDFIHAYNGKFFQTKKSITKRLQKINGNCIIFSDDIEWCKKNLNDNKIFYLEEKLKCYEEWIIMTMCKSVSYSPYSSFSKCAKYINFYLKTNHKI